MFDLDDRQGRKLILRDGELSDLLSSDTYDDLLIKSANRVRRRVYGNAVYIRGLIEMTNHCKNNCYYCGIRSGNKNAERYRLNKEDILSCCDTGYNSGFRTFVLQGGEDPFFTDDTLCDIILSIKMKYPDCAVTLSLGEKTYDSYKRYYDSGADRYLLRHETANREHYKKLHPKMLNSDFRKECLFNLKKIGYQVGSGFMIGSPYQTVDNIIEDLRFLQELDPDMIGAGPYIVHSDTPFKDKSNGDFDLTIRVIAVLRLMFPHSLIPATTALGTLVPGGREKGLSAGANVVMPNLSPVKVRKLYQLYDDKLYSGEEAAEGLEKLQVNLSKIGLQAVCSRGDVKRDTVDEL